HCNQQRSSAPVELMSTPSMSKRMPRTVIVREGICFTDDGTPGGDARIFMNSDLHEIPIGVKLSVCSLEEDPTHGTSRFPEAERLYRRRSCKRTPSRRQPDTTHRTQTARQDRRAAFDHRLRRHSGD